MPFSFDATINQLNNAANELTRAARNFGDEAPDDPLTDKLRELVAALGDAVTDLTAARDQRAAAGTSGERAVVIRDVQRDPNGMASPGADLPAGVTAKTLEADEKAAEKARAEAAKAQAEADKKAKAEAAAAAAKTS